MTVFPHLSVWHRATALFPLWQTHGNLQLHLQSDQKHSCTVCVCYYCPVLRLTTPLKIASTVSGECIIPEDSGPLPRRPPAVTVTIQESFHGELWSIHRPLAEKEVLQISLVKLQWYSLLEEPEFQLRWEKCFLTLGLVRIPHVHSDAGKTHSSGPQCAVAKEDTGGKAECCKVASLPKLCIHPISQPQGVESTK